MPDMDTLVSLCKRRGFIFQSSEIYGGLGGFWDYGPLGVELKNNIKRAWWKTVVQDRDDIVGLDTSIIMNPNVWRASSHVSEFTDPLVECKTCHFRFRADQIKGENCPNCGNKTLMPPRQFNMLFRTFVGPVEDDASVAYLRPETAQGIFVNFSNVQQTMRKKPPFGIAQIGKAFRNEIVTGNFIFRDRELEQMEIEYFVKPGTEEEWHARWRDERMNWWTRVLGIRAENIHVRALPEEELAHYSKGTFEIEYKFPMGWGEVEGIASRTDFDLRRHIETSGKNLEYFDDETKEHFIPYVIEPSMGIERCFLHPTIKMLALAFLLLIGFTLIIEGLHQHIPKGYIYFAMGFSIFVEMLNLRLRARAAQPVNLHEPYVAEGRLVPAPVAVQAKVEPRPATA